MPIRRVVLVGWNIGFDKVGLTKLLKSDLDFSLTHTKRVTEAVLDGQKPTIEIAVEMLEKFTARLDELGVNYEID